MISTMMADDVSVDSPMQQVTPAMSRKSTVEWTNGGGGFINPGMDTSMDMAPPPAYPSANAELNNNNGMMAYHQQHSHAGWPSHNNADYYRRKESLPSTFRP